MPSRKRLRKGAVPEAHDTNESEVEAISVNAPALRAALLAWYDAKARDLPCDVVVIDLEDSVTPEAKAAARAKGRRGKFAWLDGFFEFLSDSFRPILGALLGASLFITFMALMSTLKVIQIGRAHV